VQGDLERAERDFSEFASKNTAINIEAQGKAMIDAAATLEGELIAAQTELQSLKQIYTDSNVRVRATQARVDELRRNIENLSGNADGGKAEGKGGETSAYPSIRKLPLLGVSYADLYRRMKVQESIFETLTQENELAKVEEAKETPSVKVIDAPDVPERKSFPPRLEIVASGSLLALAAGVLWVLARAEWDARDTSDAGKIFAQEIFETVEAKMPWAEPNGSRVQALAHRVWVKFARERENSSAKYRGLIVRK
jgi:capsule polysaccharide export protein KpsE/RkpR